nr:MAG TPA: hypothetical protein [Caudoviricetes sp.]
MSEVLALFLFILIFPFIKYQNRISKKPSKFIDLLSLYFLLNIVIIFTIKSSLF